MKKKLFSEKSPAELDAIARQFDEENVIDKTRPLTTAERAEMDVFLAALRRSKSNSRRRVSMTIEPRLMARVDRIAKKFHVDRGAIVARCLERSLEGLE